MKWLILILFTYTTLVFTCTLLAIILIFAPRDTIKAIRYYMHDQNMWLWKKMALLHVGVSAWLWQNGNGP